VVFVVDKVALEQLSSEVFGFPCKFSFRLLLLSSEASTIGQIVAEVPSGLSLTPHPKKLKSDLICLQTDVDATVECNLKKP
jgi:hypothetical protein